jgi:hypothetical protein
LEGVDRRDTMSLPAKNGHSWSVDDVNTLTDMYYDNKPNHKIADVLERTSYAIQCKLKSLGLDHTDCDTPTTKQERPTMKNCTVTTKTFVGNTDASTLDVEQLLDLMEQEQGFIEKIGKLSQSPATTKLINKHLDNYKALEKLLGGLV